MRADVSASLRNASSVVRSSRVAVNVSLAGFVTPAAEALVSGQQFIAPTGGGSPANSVAKISLAGISSCCWEDRLCRAGICFCDSEDFRSVVTETGATGVVDAEGLCGLEARCALQQLCTMVETEAAKSLAGPPETWCGAVPSERCDTLAISDPSVSPTAPCA